MTTITKLVSAVAALAAGTVALAQNTETTSYTSSGLLGQRYVDYGFGYLDIDNSDLGVFGAGLTVNVPVAPSIDVAFNYAYEWLESYSDINSHTVSLDGIYYIDAGKFRPFGGLRLGYYWVEGDDDWFWGGLAGIEFQAHSKVVLSVWGEYEADFDDADEGIFTGLVSARYFFTEKVAAFGTFSLNEDGDKGFIAGVTMKF